VPGVSSRSLSGRVSKIKCVRVGTSSQRRVCESSLCSSACFCEDPLQLKRVTFEELPGSKDRRVRRQGGKEAICVSRREDQAQAYSGTVTS
jgi:hypothetical protein